MPFEKRVLTRVYQRTSGYCHLCYCKLAFKNYGRLGKRGAWEVEHSIPRSKGGTDHLNNLFAACGNCNRNKGTRTSRTARGWNEKTCAPLNPQQRMQAKFENGFAGAIAGGFAGGAVAGPIGAIVGAVTGACIGSSGNPDRK